MTRSRTDAMNRRFARSRAQQSTVRPLLSPQPAVGKATVKGRGVVVVASALVALSGCGEFQNSQDFRDLTTQETPARPERKRLTLAGSGMCSPIAQATGQFFKMSGPGYEIILRSEAGHTGGLLWPSSLAGKQERTNDN